MNNRGKKELLVRLLLSVTVAVTICAFTKAQTKPTIYIISDSTVCNYGASDYPWAGWGQELQLFFDSEKVLVDNRAIGGRSSRKFYEEGRWATVAALLKQGDYVFIQFGHNDRDFSKEDRYTDTTDFKKYLKRYVDESRAKGAIPVFISPMNMNTWNGTALREVFCEGANDYRGVMMRLASALDVPFIDLEKKSAAFMKTAGQEYCTYFHFMGLRAGEYPNFPDGKSDGTHFQEMGALVNARMVVEGVGELSGREEMKLLADARAALHQVTVSSNKPDAGPVTLSGAYPAGAAITLKVIPKSGETFEGWRDADGKTVATERHIVTMGTADVAFDARFKGGSTVVVAEGIAFHGDGYAAGVCRFRYRTAERLVEIGAASPVNEVDIIDSRGARCRTLHPLRSHAVVSLDGLAGGHYFIRVRTGRGTVQWGVSVE